MSILSSIGNGLKNLFTPAAPISSNYKPPVSSASTSAPNPLSGIKQTTTFPAPTNGLKTSPMTPLPKAPAPITSANMSVYKPQMSIAPKATTTKPAAAPVPSPYTSNQAPQTASINNSVYQSQLNQRKNTDFNVDVPDIIPSDALNPKNTRNGLASTAEQLQKKLIDSIGGTTESKAAVDNLAKIRNEAADLKISFDKNLEKMKLNKDGKLDAQLDADIAGLTDKYNAQLGDLGIRENAALASVQSYTDAASLLTDQIKQIKELTNEDLVGSLMTDPVTGQVVGFFRDPSTGAVEQRTVGNVSPEGPDLNKQSDNERALLAQFNGLKIVQDYNSIISSKLATDKVLESGVGGPADLFQIFTFMKALDPGSVVREAEYDTAAKSGNIFQGIFAKYNGYLKENGGILPPNVKKEFQNLINLKLKAQQQQYDNIAQQYSNIASNQGLNSANVVPDYGGALNSSQGSGSGTVIQTAVGPVYGDF